jgi:hypothetical protein
LDKYGWSNTDVDEDDFYVVGTEHGPIDHVNKIRIYKYIPPPPPPPAECPPNELCPVDVVGAAAKVKIGELQLKGGYASPSLKIYPNPASNFVNVDLKQFAEIKSLRILDINGRIIKLPAVNSFSTMVAAPLRIDISSFHTGIYFIQVVTKEERKTFKIVKL